MEVRPQRHVMNRIAVATFFLALVVTLVFAWTPHPPVLIAYDKAQHGLTFIVLAIFGRIAFRDVPWQFLGLSLAALGAVIEIIQAFPQLHRTCDVYDWYANVAAILLGLTLHTMVALWHSAAEEASVRES